MSQKRRQFDRAFKLEAVRLASEAGRSVAAVARDLGIGENLLHRWKQQFTDQQEQAFVGTGNLPPEQAELRRLRRELIDVVVPPRYRSIFRVSILYWIERGDLNGQATLYRREYHCKAS